MDFTLQTYRQLLESLKVADYEFQTFKDFSLSPLPRVIILRHDVDLRPSHSLEFARIQAKEGIRGVYYFRAVPESWDERIIKEVHSLGHEVGYHYECLTTCNGDLSKGIEEFERNLNALRKLVPVSTICMHGSPMSKFDSKDLWKKYNYRDFDIIAEPYFDVNFDNVFYLTDTGRRWDGGKVSVRDRVKSSTFNQSFHSTTQIISAVKAGIFPSQVMFNFHPQRWSDRKVVWLKELVMQNIKNSVKRLLYVQN